MENLKIRFLMRMPYLNETHASVIGTLIRGAL